MVFAVDTVSDCRVLLLISFLLPVVDGNEVDVTDVFDVGCGILSTCFVKDVVAATAIIVVGLSLVFAIVVELVDT